ncbi:LytR family transcriptional regulator [Caproiciproducens sp. NJN-50]|uniref:LCP family protein n=1 Tax=Caproiciproducens sp. NJN-50 TaxID=2507162 RepID=UPI000FFE2666|nr:LCP family protein [Caproiciproducens sp. NJN-50]QAT48801.1 LytR family transcriptional regulator [Caproiciproducens sp. NJN-50]
MSRQPTGRPARRTDPLGTSRASNRQPARRAVSWDTQEIDRYNVVDRDIYSDSSMRSRSRRRRRKKGGCLKKILILLFSVALAAMGGGFLYFHLLASRLDRSDVTSSQLANYTQLPSDAPAWNVKSDDSVMNILLLGVDENDDGSDGRSDTNMLMSIDSKSKTIRLVSFLRDSYLEIPTVGKNKLNAAYSNGGVALTMQTLENNYRINIDQYVSVDFDNFAAVIDKMGGLDVPMSKAACQAENENMGSHLSYPAAGEKSITHHLNGKLCLYYARIRYATDSFGSNDYGRTARQRQVVELMIRKIKSMNLVSANKIVYDYLPYVKTNLSDSQLLYLASIGASLSGYETETQQIPATDTFDDTVSVKGIGKVVSLDLEKNCTILRQFLYGDEDSSGSDSD